MCGIAGYMSRRGREVAPGVLLDMSERIKHRGPDGEGLWRDGPFHLAHRRLSIIDLQTGDQPMIDATTGAVVVFNGEIYNYVELREQLAGRRPFRTRSDTEVLLHLYAENGTGMLPDLNGMFAFALADPGRDALFLARDRVGKKPLFYYLDDDWLVFGSEVKALLAHPEVPAHLDGAAFVDYLSLNYVPGPRTLIAGIHRLLPGSWMRVGRTGVETGRYWEPGAAGAGRPPRTEAAALDQLDELLSDATRLRLRSDVPVGVFLSGGVDSSLVAAAARRHGSLVKAFTLGFAERQFSEEPAAREVASILDLPIEVIQPDDDHAADIFEDLVWHADDPLADSSCLPMYLLSRRTAKEVKVVLSGDGGDELFGGYLTYRATRLASLLKPWVGDGLGPGLAALLERVPASTGKVAFDYRLQRFARGLGLSPAAAHFSWNGTWCGPQKLALVSDELVEHILCHGSTFERLADQYGLDPRRPALRDLQRADIQEYLANDILVKCDRMSMAYGLEVRAPLLDYRIVEWALNLPDEWKVAKGRTTKYLLRRLMGRTFPAELANRAKQGFSIPVHRWLRTHFRPLVEELLSRERLDDVGVLNPAGVRRVVELHLQGRRSYGFEIWGLMVFMAWLRRLGVRTPVPA